MQPEPMRRIFPNGESWVLTRVQDDASASRHLHYVLPDGTRDRVTIDQAHDTPDMRAAIGDALAKGRRRITQQ